MADELEGARTLPVKFLDQGDGSVAERVGAAGYIWNAVSGWTPAPTWTDACDIASDAAPAKSTPGVLGLAYDPADGKIRRPITGSTDGIPSNTPPLGVNATAYNGATYDRQRGNTEGTLQALGSRSGTQTWTLTNHNGRGLLVYLNIATPGTGTLALQVFDARVGFVIGDFAGVAVDTTYCVYPGAVGGGGAAPVAGKVAALPVPRSAAVRVTPSDGSTWEYAVDYALIV